jgi:hypothetical protein
LSQLEFFSSSANLLSYIVEMAMYISTDLSYVVTDLSLSGLKVEMYKLVKATDKPHPFDLDFNYKILS